MAKCSGFARVQGDFATFKDVHAFLWPLALYWGCALWAHSLNFLKATHARGRFLHTARLGIPGLQVASGLFLWLREGHPEACGIQPVYAPAFWPVGSFVQLAEER